MQILSWIGIRRRLYIRIGRERLSIRIVDRSGLTSEFSGVPKIIFFSNTSRDPIPNAVGDEVNKYNESDIDGVIITEFRHPRVVIDDFDLSVIMLSIFINKAVKNSGFESFDVILQITDNLEGGLTQIEKRALQELGLKCGKGRCIVDTTNQELSDTEILNYHFT